MFTLSCGPCLIPLPFVSSVSWAKTAKVVKHNGGYISARGYEATEISVKAKLNPAICSTFGYDYQEMLDTFRNLRADRLGLSSVFYFGGFPIYPEVEFAITNINRTYIADQTGKPYEMDMDLIFSGVKAVKEVCRQRALSIEDSTTVPDVILSVGNKQLVVKDSFQITNFITAPDSVALSLAIGSDMDLVSRDGFLQSLLDGGTIIVDLPQGKTTFYIISADLVDEGLELAGSFYPPQAMQSLVKTYQNTDISAIILDLAKLAGVECECKVRGQITYYQAVGSPLICLKELQQSAGFLISFRQNKLYIVQVPTQIVGKYDLEYDDLSSDTDRETVKGVYWQDGLHHYKAGTVDYTSTHIRSYFTSDDSKWAEECLKFARYSNNAIQIEKDILESIVQHSAITLRSNDSIVDCLADYPTFDWLNWVMNIECKYISRMGN